MNGDIKQLGPYRLLRKLGEGGMGAVFLAEHAVTSRKAAVKVLDAALSNDPEYVNRFKREAKVAALLRHNNIMSAGMTGEEGVLHFSSWSTARANRWMFGVTVPPHTPRSLRRVWVES